MMMIFSKKLSCTLVTCRAAIFAHITQKVNPLPALGYGQGLNKIELWKTMRCCCRLYDKNLLNFLSDPRLGISKILLCYAFTLMVPQLNAKHHKQQTRSLCDFYIRTMNKPKKRDIGIDPVEVNPLFKIKKNYLGCI